MTDVNRSVPFVSSPAHDDGFTARRLSHLLRDLPLLQSLPSHDRTSVLALCLEGAVFRQWHAGQALFTQGRPATHFVILTSGQVEVARDGTDGTQRIYGRFSGGDTVAEAAMFMPGGHYPATARAASASAGWWCTRAAIRNAAHQHPTFALTMLEVVSQRMQQRINELDRLVAVNAPQRLAGWFLEQLRVQGRQIARIGKQSQLAAELAMRPETLSRLISQWSSAGWIEKAKDHWTVHDTQALSSILRNA